MSLPQHQFLQKQHPQHQLPFNAHLGNFYEIDGRISPPVAYLNVDQPNHPSWFDPVPAPATDGDGFHLNYGVESKRKRLKEQDFLENNNHSPLSSIDFMQARSVSTGLGLSLDNGRLASSGDSSFLGLVGDEIDIELQRQDAEIDRFLKVQGDKLRQGLLEKLQAKQFETISYIEEKALQKLREKEAEIETINRKNMELEIKMEQLNLELAVWQQRAKQNEDTINALKFNLQQIYARSRDSKEGCGDSEVDDTASCCNGRVLDFHLLCKGNHRSMMCKVCGLNRVCMLSLPCKHLCSCKECEDKVSVCPLCHLPKYMGLEVYM